MTNPSAQLKLIRETINQASPDWQFSFDGRGEIVSVRDDADFTQDDEAAPDDDIVLVEIATINALNPADAQLLREAKSYSVFLLDLLDQSFAEVRRLKPFEVFKTEKPDKDYTTNCAIMCGEEPFIRFLQDQHNLQSTDKEAVAKKVQELCQISSRKQLNQSMEKADNWRRLAREFEEWMRSGGLSTQ